MSGDTGRWRFDRFELDPRAETLRRDGRKIRLQPQPLRVLVILIEHAGRIVPREELQRRVWNQATFVEFDQGLNYCIRQIRLSLGDDPEQPRFIETIRRKGYQFIAAVERVPDAPAAESGGLAAAPIPAAIVERPPASRLGWLTRLAIAAAILLAVIGAVAARMRTSPPPASSAYTQLTSFTKAAFSPALSSDGRTIAFLVGSDASFPPIGEVYTRALPDGEPVQRTHDGWPKYGVRFSPDDSMITYTVADATHGWITQSLDVRGGEPRLFAANAAGLTWIDPQHVLFGEIRHGLHMALVAATAARAEVRDVYLPAHDRGMAHVGVASPDRSSVLIVEMGPTGGWERCRLVPATGGSPGAAVGPDGPCTAAAWSPDGAWMYFTAHVNGASHLWRQRAPAGELEQLTFGPGEEEGLAVGADGRSIVTSLGMMESGVWLHGAAGDRLISPEGYARSLSFSADGASLYYVMRRTATSLPELWVTDLRSGRSERVIQGHAVDFYDVSPDGTQVVFSERAIDGRSHLWLASRDGRVTPRQLSSGGEDQPFFGPDGRIFFRASEDGKNYVFSMARDATNRSRLRPEPIVQINGISPDRQRLLLMVPVEGLPSTAVVAVTTGGGASAAICPAACMARWSPDGRWLYVEPLLQGGQGGQTAVIPVPEQGSLPSLPPAGVHLATDARAVPGARIIDLSDYDPGHLGTVAPALTPDTFAFARTVSHRNLFRIQVR